MNFNTRIPIFLLGLILTFSASSQITEYDNLTDWLANASPVCFTEDLEGFTADVDFSTTSISLNGFTITHSGTSPFRNLVEVPPFQFTDNNGTNHLSLHVDANAGEEIIITFDQPICGFYSEYTAAATGGVLMEVYNDNMGMIGSFTHNQNSINRGITTPINMPITSIVMSSGGTGEGFSLDDIQIACCDECSPFPVLSVKRSSSNRN